MASRYRLLVLAGAACLFAESCTRHAPPDAPAEENAEQSADLPPVEPAPKAAPIVAPATVTAAPKVAKVDEPKIEPDEQTQLDADATGITTRTDSTDDMAGDTSPAGADTTSTNSAAAEPAQP